MSAREVTKNCLFVTTLIDGMVVAPSETNSIKILKNDYCMKRHRWCHTIQKFKIYVWWNGPTKHFIICYTSGMLKTNGGGIAGIPHTSRTNFVLICRNISSSINLLFMKCGQAMLSCWLVARWFGGQRGLEP